MVSPLVNNVLAHILLIDSREKVKMAVWTSILEYRQQKYFSKFLIKQMMNNVFYEWFLIRCGHIFEK